MSKKKATSSDVAQRAGVSQATVSMVLNKKYNVSFSRETVEKRRTGSQRIRLPASGPQKQERQQEGETDRCLLPNSDEPILCTSAPGSRGSRKQARLWRLYLQYTKRCPSGGEIRFG